MSDDRYAQIDESYTRTCGALFDREITEMLRESLPPAPKIARDPRPEDSDELERWLRKGATCLIPTSEVLGTVRAYRHKFKATGVEPENFNNSTNEITVILRERSVDFKFVITKAEDPGWSRVTPDHWRLLKDVPAPIVRAHLSDLLSLATQQYLPPCNEASLSFLFKRMTGFMDGDCRYDFSKIEQKLIESLRPQLPDLFSSRVSKAFGKLKREIVQERSLKGRRHILKLWMHAMEKNHGKIRRVRGFTGMEAFAILNQY